MEPKILSSSQTVITKFIFPALWISGFGGATVLMWLNVMHGKDGLPPPYPIKFIFLIVTIAGSTFLWFFCGGLKQVRLGGGTLYVSNYLKEVEIPVSLIAKVTENRWVNSHPVTIYFSQTTVFGDSVTFMPGMRLSGFNSSHPVVEELTKAAEAARS